MSKEMEDRINIKSQSAIVDRPITGCSAETYRNTYYYWWWYYHANDSGGLT